MGQGSREAPGAGEKEDAGTRGHGDTKSRGAPGAEEEENAGTRGAAGHTDLRKEISRVGGNLEPRVLVSASSPLRVSPEGTLRTSALLTPHYSDLRVIPSPCRHVRSGVTSPPPIDVGHREGRCAII
ncbi:MAG: hypothetical protein BRC36_10080 [Cyanobacteria bacterium QH_2_48_84]|nr:MAG: hypothetical protein BRC36_10080 [Cyanobacteria bacterium QH_2_48_84]